MSTCKRRGCWEHRAWGQGWGQGDKVLTDLPGSQGHFGVLGLAELRQLVEDGCQLICQRGVTATELVLQSTHHHGLAQAPHRRMASSHIPSTWGTRSEELKWANAAL